MRIAIAYSTLDPVGVRVSELIALRLGARQSSCPMATRCLELGDGVVMGGFGVDDVLFEFLDRSPDPSAEAVIVLSRHESSSRTRSLTVHFTGNPTDEARFGGRPRELSYAPADLGMKLLEAYAREAESLGLRGEYEVTLEATHHGPTGNSMPLVFIEVGSTEAEWSDRRALEAMASAVESALAGTVPSCTTGVGFGSTHYPRTFTSIELRGEACFGHIISKHAVGSLSDDVISQAVRKTLPGGARVAYIERGSVKSAARAALAKALSNLGVEVRET